MGDVNIGVSKGARNCFRFGERRSAVVRWVDGIPQDRPSGFWAVGMR